MNKVFKILLTVIVTLTLIIVGLTTGIELDSLQKETLNILLIICAASALYCFLVGEISRNNSQMDKLWSILPIIYALVITIKSGFNFRLIVMTILIAIWGIRLTMNFALKGAYSFKFWEGEEDYRWVIVRNSKTFNKKWKWAIFDFAFISVYQNALVLAICLPMLASMSSEESFGVMDIIATILTVFFIAYEYIADREQMKFQTEKWRMINEGKKLKELPAPYNLGFNTVGLWKVSRHPNYLGEQAIWICLYLFTIGAGVTKYGVFNWTIVGCMLLILLFLGSSTLAENISSSKYPKYKDYQKKVFKYLPLRKYKEK